MKRSSDAPGLVTESLNKKPKVHSGNNLQTINNSTPRRVLHIRGLSEEIEASDIVQYAIPFGKIANLMFAKKSHQALLEMEDLDAAIAMVNHYFEKPLMCNRKTIYIQYSKYDALDKDLSTQHANVIKAVNAANNTYDSSAKPTSVLRVFIENKIYPITLNALKQIFSAHGEVLKIVTFIKNSIWQALVQMQDNVAAMNAKNYLNGKNVYDGCCTLKIEYSHLDSLKVRFNNDKSFDFTNPNLPQGSRDDNESQNSISNEINDLYSREFGGHTSINSICNNPLDTNLLTNALMQKIQILPNLNNVAQLVGLRSVVNTNTIGFKDQNISSLNSGNFYYQNMPGSKKASQKHSSFDEDNSFIKDKVDNGKVVLVSNLDEKKITPDDIFILFGVYGNVLRVKILFNNKDSALVEFEDDYQARDAIQNLKGISWHGKTINVIPSKYSTIKMPNKGCEEPWLTKDFTGSKLHRFRQLNSKNHRHIFPPSSTLHLSNIPESTTEQFLIDLFQEYGNVVSFKFSATDNKIAWIKLDSVQSAIQALIKLHDYKLSSTNSLRVSFTGHNL